MSGTTLNLFDIHRAKARKGDLAGAAVVEMFIQECDILAYLPLRTLGTVETSSTRTNSIPTVGFRAGRGERFGEIAGIEFDEVTDAVWHLGAEIDIDKIDLRDKEAGDVLGQRSRLAVKGMSWTFNDYFINGDHANDPYGFEGLKVRLANSPDDQIVHADDNDSATFLDVRQSANPSESDMYKFLDKIDETIEQLDGGTADMVLTDADFIASLRSVLRRLGKYTERPVDAPQFYGNVKRRTSSVKPKQPALIYPEDLGLKWYAMGFKADQSTRVVGNIEIDGEDTRPAYFIKTGREYLHGIQQYPVEVSEPFKLDDGVTHRVTVDWPVGLHMAHIKSLAELRGMRVK